nr:glycosyltransferase 4 family protein [Pyrococcus abyssi]
MYELLAFALSLALTPYIAKLMKNAGIVGIDVHKVEKVEVPEMGGLALLISISLVSLLAKINGWILAVFLLMGLVGVIDDSVALKQSHKVLLSIMATFPIVAYINRDYIVIIKPIHVGVLAVLVLWMYVVASTNLVNMLAGFNGLEVGMSSVILFFIAILGEGSVRMLALIGLFASLGFLYWNKYPAKVFPGDTGTLSLGTLIGLLAILGKLEFPVAIMLIPHALDFVLKAKVRFKGKQIGRTRVLEDGTLVPPPYKSFLGLLMRIKPMKEWELVLASIAIEFFLGIVALLIQLA